MKNKKALPLFTLLPLDEIQHNPLSIEVTSFEFTGVQFNLRMNGNCFAKAPVCFVREH